MRHTLLYIGFVAFVALSAKATNISSPDGKTVVTINDKGGLLTYSVTYGGKVMLTPSRLGIVTDAGDYSRMLTLQDTRQSVIDTTYVMSGTKCRSSHYVANSVAMTFSVPDAERLMTLEMQVSNNNIAYRYSFDGAKTTYRDEPRRITILREVT